MYRKYLALSVVAVATVSLVACINIDINLFGGDDTPVVEVGDTEFEVEVADTPLLRQRGLTGRSYLEERKGMLFIPDERYVGPFWMKGMLFPLDFIWIGSDCRVADVTVFARVPAPGTPGRLDSAIHFVPKRGLHSRSERRRSRSVRNQSRRQGGVREYQRPLLKTSELQRTAVSSPAMLVAKTGDCRLTD